MTTATTAKATPGPWRVLDASGRRAGKDWARIAPCIAGHKAIAEILSIHEKGKREAGDFEIEKANARLIAAAPVLLEALIKMIDHAQEQHPHFESERGMTDINRSIQAVEKGLAIKWGDVRLEQ